MLTFNHNLNTSKINHIQNNKDENDNGQREFDSTIKKNNKVNKN